jgi:hypothetical protein
MRIFSFLLLLFCFASVSAVAQIRPGIRAGGLLSVPNVTSELLNGVKPKPAPGWTAGLFTTIPLGKNGLYMSPELGLLYYAYDANGTVNFPGVGMVSVTGNSHITYAHLPLHVGYVQPKGPVRFFAEAGGYIAIGLSGENNLKGTVGGQTFNNDGPIRFGRNNGEVRRADVGASLAAGLLLRDRFSIRLQAANGFTTVSNESFGSFRNRYIGLSLGFGGFSKY